MRRVLMLVGALALALILGLSAPVYSAETTTVRPGAAQAKKKKHRRGGKVRAAWPRSKKAKAPKNRLARWLAKQVGPTPRKKKKRSRRALASDSTTALSSAGGGKLWLIRSFEIPPSDSAYNRLVNYSWTYDNALATFAFIGVGLRSGAEQLLDQLQALQRTDGSLEFAFDTKTGDAAPYYRSGALAWVGMAAAGYRRKYDSDRYDKLIGGVIKYLLSLRNSDGLIRGGPDVSWVSTQHNLLAVGFLRDIADQMSSKETLGGFTRSQLTTIHTALGNAIVAKLLVVDSPTLAHFKQGVDDPQTPIDVQALGAMFLKLRGDARATSVANTIQAQFPVASRRVSGSSSYVSGYKPFTGSGVPDVIWSEGTIEAAVALDRLNITSATATAAVTSIYATSIGSTTGPIGADREAVSPVWGEYHTWPTSAAASWLLIAADGGDLLLAR
jgi:hypothetical protein